MKDLLFSNACYLRNHHLPLAGLLTQVLLLNKQSMTNFDLGYGWLTIVLQKYQRAQSYHWHKDSSCSLSWLRSVYSFFCSLLLCLPLCFYFATSFVSQSRDWCTPFLIRKPAIRSAWYASCHTETGLHLMHLSLCRRNITELRRILQNWLELSSNGQALLRPASISSLSKTCDFRTTRHLTLPAPVLKVPLGSQGFL